MRINLVGFICLFGFIFLIGCGTKSSNENAIQYSMKKFESSIKDSNSLTSGSAKITFEYPEINKSANSQVKDSLEGHVKKLFLECYSADQKLNSYQEMKDTLFSQYKRQRKDFPDSPQSWELEGNASVVYNENSIVSVRTTIFSYLGGAHPNQVVNLQSFNASNGIKIKLTDIIRDKGELNIVAEKIFRKLKSLKPDDDLEKAGYWFDKGKFLLNDNFCVTARGLLFYYNSYEIIYYAAGPTELLIPFSEIKNLIRKDSLLPNAIGE